MQCNSSQFCHWETWLLIWIVATISIHLDQMKEYCCQRQLWDSSLNQHIFHFLITAVGRKKGILTPFSGSSVRKLRFWIDFSRKLLQQTPRSGYLSEHPALSRSLRLQIDRFWLCFHLELLSLKQREKTLSFVRTPNSEEFYFKCHQGVSGIYLLSPVRSLGSSTTVRSASPYIYLKGFSQQSIPWRMKQKYWRTDLLLWNKPIFILCHKSVSIYRKLKIYVPIVST